MYSNLIPSFSVEERNIFSGSKSVLIVLVNWIAVPSSGSGSFSITLRSKLIKSTRAGSYNINNDTFVTFCFQKRTLILVVFMIWSRTILGCWFRSTIWQISSDPRALIDEYPDWSRISIAFNIPFCRSNSRKLSFSGCCKLVEYTKNSK